MREIGYTAGVFDLFHVGHLNLLRRAKLECRRLIVGVTTDELALTEKGERPLFSFAQRAEIVEAIRYVDLVVPQTSYDKMAAWHALRFDVMFVGDDWKGTEKWNKLDEQFSRLGVSIRYLPYTPHTSSTRIRVFLDALQRRERGCQANSR